MLEEARAETAEPRGRARATAHEAGACVLRALHHAPRRTPPTTRSKTSRRRSARGGFMNRTLDALWPRPKSDQLLRRLLTSPGAARRGSGRHPRRGRAAAPAVRPRQGLERRRPAAPRRGAGAARGRRPAARPPDRRRGAGPDADATAHARAPLDGAVHRSSATSRRSSGPISYRAGTTCSGTWRRTGANGRGAAPRLPRPRDVLELALPLLPLIAPDVAAADRLPRWRRAAALRARGAGAPRRRGGARGRPRGAPRRTDGADRARRRS